MEMNPDTIKTLLDAFDRSDWREMTITVGSDRLHVSRDSATDGAAPAPPAADRASQAEPSAAEPSVAPARAAEPSAPPAVEPEAPVAEPAEIPATGTKIESPSVGLFWRAPSPGAPPFVEVGDRVAGGETVAIVEVMKLMNHVVSPVDGVVSAILVENGASVEFGQALVVVDPQD